MIGPPDPGIPALLLAAAARLGYHVVSRDPSGRELGVFSDTSGQRPLVIGAGAAPGTCVWVLLDAGPMPRMAFLMTRATHDALRAGSLDHDGSLLYHGKRCQLRATFEGIVELIEEQTAA